MPTLDRSQFHSRVESLREMLGRCEMCPRRCGVDRLAGETGFCGVGPEILLARALPHFGEEPPVSGSRGAGTVFLSSCNLRCVYCQNHQISHSCGGAKMTPAQLSGALLELQRRGCHNIEAVTPTPQVPQFVESVYLAREAGLYLPLVYNCGGYEDRETIKLLDGIVDVYLPDFKYGLDDAARELSGVDDYCRHAADAIGEMVGQVGTDLRTDGEIASRGIIIRHLVLPGMPQNSIAALERIKKEFSADVPLSLMAQYTPTAAMRSHPALAGRLTRPEYDFVVNAALDMDFGTIFTQEVDERDLAPDFGRAEPFQWL
ncbi:MAG TPA: radical SAM protein [Thermodesulfobacteriota bacterium]|nr:radical SAM protein [Thermodesulfobacteriota bacterium]